MKIATLKRQTPLTSLIIRDILCQFETAVVGESWDKIVFGSDVHFSQIKKVIANYRGILEALKVGKATQNKIFGETAMQILKMKIN
ncbi:hypothetical protein ES703_113056 [subsurface metagenome]